MTFERFKKIVDSVDLRMWPAKLEVHTDLNVMACTVSILVNMTGNDRETNKPQKFVQTHNIPYWEIEHLRDDEDAIDLIYCELRAVVLHELDECLLVCGRRVRDPHADARSPAFTLPSPMPPPLPRHLPPGPYGRTIKIAAGGRVVEYKPTGELIA